MAETDISIIVRVKDEATRAIEKINDSLGAVHKNGLEPAAMASKAFAGALLGAGVAAAGVGTIAVNAARDHMKSQNQLNAVLASTKGIAGVTAEQVNNLAAEFSKLTNFEDDAIVSGQNMLLTFTNIGKDVFPTATETMLDMSAALGQDMKASAIQLGKALNDPILGVSALREVGVAFTEEQQKQIETLVKSGKTMEAQKMILRELATEFGGSAKATADPIIQLKNSVGELFESLGMQLLPAVNKVAQAALHFANDVLPPWIERAGEIVKWIKEHKEIVIIVAGAIVGALVPAMYAWATAMVPVIAAFAASAVALAPFIIGGAIIAGIVLGVKWIIDNFDMLKAKAIEVFNSIPNSVKIAVAILFAPITALIGIGYLLIKNWNDIKAAAVAVWTALGEFFKATWEVIKQVFEIAIALILGLTVMAFEKMGIDIIAVMQGLISFLQQAWEFIKQVFNAALDFVVEYWTTQWNIAKAIVTAVWNAIKVVVQAGWNFIMGLFKQFAAPFAEAFGGMWERAKNIVTSVWESIKTTVSSSINFLIDKINKFINAVNSAASKAAGAFGFNAPQIPNIPKLAQGGIVTKPTIAMIGEAGTEAVVPLNKADKYGFGGGNGVTIVLQGTFMTSREQAEYYGDMLAGLIKEQVRV